MTENQWQSLREEQKNIGTLGAKAGKKSPRERTLSLGHFLSLSHEHLLSSYHVTGTMLMSLDKTVCSPSPYSVLEWLWTTVQ